MYEEVHSYVVFANKNEKGEVKLATAIKIHEEKSKKIKTIAK